MESSPTSLLIGITDDEGAASATSIDPSLEVIKIDSLSALGLPITSSVAPGDPTHSRLLRFHDAIDRIWKEIALVPFRFGHYYSSPEDLERQLTPHLDQWWQLVEKLRDCAEISLTTPVVFAAEEALLEDAPPKPKGRAFLEKRRRDFIRDGSLSSAVVEELQTQLLQALGEDRVRDHRRFITSQPDHNLLELVVLIHRDDIPEMIWKAEALDFPDLVISPAWAPMSFAAPASQDPLR